MSESDITQEQSHLPWVSIKDFADEKKPNMYIYYIKHLKVFDMVVSLHTYLFFYGSFAWDTTLTILKKHNI
jgi:hypothetical protein